MKKGVIHVVPQSHIDVAWLWRYDPETIHRCCKPTFTLAVDNMDRYPDYTFAQSQVPLYQATEEVYPSLFDRIREYVREGRWEIVGGMYVEFEGGEPCGESLVRQCVVGKRYFLERFGVDITTGWQEDAWSHPWQLPQILKKCGINSYMFKRGEKGESLFWWQSPDGSRVLACKPLHRLTPSPEWTEFFNNMANRYGVRDVMVRIGRGDHGGGPTPVEIEAVKRFAKEVAPEVEVMFSTFRRFADSILAQNPDLPVLNDELGFELVGDLTNCGEIKRGNRECENLLLTAEKFCSIASILSGCPYPAEELYESWKKVLFNQFHDIIGGSGIPPVCRDAMRFYEIVRESGRRLLGDSIPAVLGNVNTEGEGKPIVVLNPLSWTRTDVVEVEVSLPEKPTKPVLLDDEGEYVPAQIVEEREDNGGYTVRLVFIAEDVPSLGYRTYRLIGDTSDSYPQETDLSLSDLTLENKRLRVEIDPDSGYVRGIFDKGIGKELLGREMGNLIVAIEDEGDSEGRFVKGSDTIAKPPGKEWTVDTEPEIGVCEVGPVRARIRVRRRFRRSTFIQDVILYSRLARVDFNLTVDWHDVHWMIKVAFPLNVERPTVTYDTAYGTVVRPADGLEYPAQKWVDLSGEDYGVSLLNNARYGHDVQGSTVRMSLLRSPTEPAYNTDEGIHRIGYSIYPHPGTWKDGEVMRRGYEFNFPLMAVVESPHPGELPSRFSFMRINPEDVIVEVLKRAYDSDDFILRLYETHGKGSEVEVRVPWRISSACETDLMERRMGEVEFEEHLLRFELSPYEIKTIRFTPVIFDGYEGSAAL
jgi:alpha-mannosidase